MVVLDSLEYSEAQLVAQCVREQRAGACNGHKAAPAFLMVGDRIARNCFPSGPEVHLDERIHWDGVVTMDSVGSKNQVDNY